MKELGVQLIAARSPQAKGRIERLWETIQDRLPIEFAIRGITDVDGANEFLKTYIYSLNSLFAVEPEDAETVFTKPPEDAETVFTKPPEGLNLDYVLCVKEPRTVDNGGVFSYCKKNFKVCEDIHTGILPPRAKVTVLASPVFGIKVEFRKIVYSVDLYAAPKHISQVEKEMAKTREQKPVPDSHYYKYGKYFAPAIAYTEDDAEVMEMLYEIFLRKYA